MIRFAFFVSVAALAAPVQGIAEDAKPKIILIMADDFGYECVAANGGESYETPHLDRLAAGGMLFEHCHVQPLCTPTRVQLMTGLYNVRNYFSFGKIGRDATTFAHALKEAGYATAIAGKWQLGRAKNLPQRLGFDEAVLWQHTRRPPRYANPGLEFNGEERDYTGGEYGPDVVNDFALDFITRHKEKPFFLYYPMMLTHAPFQPTPDSANWDPKARGERVSNEPKHFGEMVTYTDKLIGKVAAKLDELGIRENTLILFLGDNGTDWPKRIAAGSVNDDLISSTDFLPTLCNAAGSDVPEATRLDGQSFFPQLVGEPGMSREWLYCWFGKGPGLKDVREFAMTKEHKLYRSGKFYDLTSDPFEERPRQVSTLTGADAEAARKLSQALAQYADARPPEVTAAATAAKPDKAQKSKRPNNGRKARRAAGARS
jgi:arylsulfatase A